MQLVWGLVLNPRQLAEGQFSLLVCTLALVQDGHRQACFGTEKFSLYCDHKWHFFTNYYKKECDFFYVAVQGNIICTGIAKNKCGIKRSFSVSQITLQQSWRLISVSWRRSRATWPSAGLTLSSHYPSSGNSALSVERLQKLGMASLIWAHSLTNSLFHNIHKINLRNMTGMCCCKKLISLTGSCGAKWC